MMIDPVGCIYLIITIICFDRHSYRLTRSIVLWAVNPWTEIGGKTNMFSQNSKCPAEAKERKGRMLNQQHIINIKTWQRLVRVI